MNVLLGQPIKKELSRGQSQKQGITYRGIKVSLDFLQFLPREAKTHTLSLRQGERAHLFDCSKSHTLAFSHRAGMSLQQSLHPTLVPKVGDDEEDSN